MKLIYLLIKEQRTNSGFCRNTINAFTNPDIAKLSEVKCNYYAEQFTKYFIEEIRLNDSEGLFSSAEVDEVILKDDYDNTFCLDILQDHLFVVRKI